jgi:hypothetical protein
VLNYESYQIQFGYGAVMVLRQARKKKDSLFSHSYIRHVKDRGRWAGRAEIFSSGSTLGWQ